MNHSRKLDRHFYKEWCPELTLIEKYIYRSTSFASNKIDLHHYTIHDAYLKVLNFIEESYRGNVFEIYIVTGASGKIKKEFPSWICSHKLVKSQKLISSGEFKVWLIRRT